MSAAVRQRRRWWRSDNPASLLSVPVITIWLAVYLLTWVGDGLLADWLGSDVAGHGLRLLMVAGSVVAWGFIRAGFYSPVSRRGYAEWLATTPWTSNRPLPFGPLRLTWIDAVLIGLAGAVLTTNMLVAGGTGGAGVELPEPDKLPEAFAGLVWLGEWVAEAVHPWLGAWVLVTLPLAGLFLLPYVFLAGLQLTARPWERRVVMALLPLVLYPRFEVLQAVATLAIAAVVVDFGQRRMLRTLPYAAVGMDRDPREVAAEEAAGLVGYAFGGVAPRPADADPVVSRPWAMLANRAIFAWWLTVIAGVVWHAEGGAAWVGQALVQGSILDTTFPGVLVAWPLLSGILLVARLMRYLSQRRPPVSLLGRLRTGRLVLPRYDVVWVVPVLIVGWWWQGPGVLASFGLSGAGVVWAAVFVQMVLARLGPPTPTAWDHTGQHRVTVPAAPESGEEEDGL